LVSPSVLTILLEVVEASTAGSPTDVLRWTSKSKTNLAVALAERRYRMVLLHRRGAAYGGVLEAVLATRPTGLSEFRFGARDQWAASLLHPRIDDPTPMQEYPRKRIRGPLALAVATGRSARPTAAASGQCVVARFQRLKSLRFGMRTRLLRHKFDCLLHPGRGVGNRRTVLGRVG
jgi:hypothetical protein